MGCQVQSVKCGAQSVGCKVYFQLHDTNTHWTGFKNWSCFQISRVESCVARSAGFNCIESCGRTAGNHSFLLGPQGLNAFTCDFTCRDVRMKLSRLKCVSSLCSGHATVLNRWSRNRKLSHSSSTWRVSNRQSCTQFSFTAIAL